MSSSCGGLIAINKLDLAVLATARHPKPSQDPERDINQSCAAVRRVRTLSLPLPTQSSCSPRVERFGGPTQPYLSLCMSQRSLGFSGTRSSQHHCRRSFSPLFRGRLLASGESRSSNEWRNANTVASALQLDTTDCTHIGHSVLASRRGQSWPLLVRVLARVLSRFVEACNLIDVCV